jgi:cysteine desulfurase / selenocysteine lyase
MMPPVQEPPLIYLNNAATSWPKPVSVLAEVEKSLGIPVFEHGRSTMTGAIDYPAETREALARFFHAEKPDHFVFTGNATGALNILIHGFAKNTVSPFHAITTELDHNSVLRPLHALEVEGKLSISIAPFTENHVDLAAIKKSVRPETRLVVMTHGSNVLGSVQDLRQIAEYLTANEIFLIADGAQTAGHIPVDLSDTPVDAFVFTGHKALFGIPGSGGFYLRDPEMIAITMQGGTGTDSKSPEHPAEMPTRFEAGTPGYPAIASLLAGIRYIESVGLSEIERKGNELPRHFIEELLKAENIEVYNKTPDLPIVSFNIREIDNDEAGYILARAYNIITRTGIHCAPLVHERIDGGRGCIRASFSWFNTLEECERAARAIREVAEECAS